MKFVCEVLFILIPLIDAMRQGKIIGGLEAIPHSIPYQAAIITESKSSHIFNGGSLISQNAILTAAHCLHNFNRALVILGAHNLSNVEAGAYAKWVDSTDFRIHSDFNYKSALMDIALIILSTPVNYSQAIQPIQLPSGNLLNDKFIGDIATISGFGKTCEDCKLSPELRVVRNRIMENSKCSEQIGVSSIPSENQLCLTTVGMKGTCVGDSGSPLTIIRNGSKIQIGLASFGVVLCEKEIPAIMTRLTRNLVEWILEEIDKT